MVKKITFNYKLLSFNEIRKNIVSSVHFYNNEKQSLSAFVKDELNTIKFRGGELPSGLTDFSIGTIWVMNKKGMDLDNYSFNKKFLMDSLKEYGIIRDDNLCNISLYLDVATKRENPLIADCGVEGNSAFIIHILTSEEEIREWFELFLKIKESNKQYYIATEKHVPKPKDPSVPILNDKNVILPKAAETMKAKDFLKSFVKVGKRYIPKKV